MERMEFDTLPEGAVLDEAPSSARPSTMEFDTLPEGAVLDEAPAPKQTADFNRLPGGGQLEVYAGEREPYVGEDFSSQAMHSASIAGRAAVRGARSAISGLEQTREFLTDREKYTPEYLKAQPSEDPELDALLSKKVGEGWKDPNWWIAKSSEMLAESSPMLAGTVVGGGVGTVAAGPAGTVAGSAAGTAVGAMLPTLGRAYYEARHTMEPDEAFEQAWKQTGIAGAFGAVAGALPGVSVFGKTAEGALKAPMKEAIFQLFGAQPATAVAQAATSNVVAGRPNTAEELFEPAIVGALTGAVQVGAHRGYTKAFGKEKPVAEPPPGATERPPGEAEKPAEEITAEGKVEFAPEDKPAGPPPGAPPEDIDAHVAELIRLHGLETAPKAAGKVVKKAEAQDLDAVGNDATKGYRTGNNPPPNEAAAVGNDVNPPRRDQGSDPATAAVGTDTPSTKVGEAVSTSTRPSVKLPETDIVNSTDPAIREAVGAPPVAVSEAPTTPKAKYNPETNTLRAGGYDIQFPAADAVAIKPAGGLSSDYVTIYKEQPAQRLRRGEMLLSDVNAENVPEAFHQDIRDYLEGKTTPEDIVKRLNEPAPEAPTAKPEKLTRVQRRAENQRLRKEQQAAAEAQRQAAAGPTRAEKRAQNKLQFEQRRAAEETARQQAKLVSEVPTEKPAAVTKPAAAPVSDVTTGPVVTEAVTPKGAMRGKKGKRAALKKAPKPKAEAADTQTGTKESLAEKSEDLAQWQQEQADREAKVKEASAARKGIFAAVGLAEARAKEAPPSVGPKAFPIIEKAKRRTAPKKAEAVPAKEKPVTQKAAEALSVQEKQPRVLRPVAEIEQEKKDQARIKKGGRGLGKEEPPNMEDKNRRAQFIRRAKAAVRQKGEEAPQYYKDAVAADAVPVKRGKQDEAGRQRLKNIEAAWNKEFEAIQAGEEAQAVKGEVKGQVRAAEEKAATKEETAVETALTPKDKTAALVEKVTDAEIDRLVKKYPELAGRPDAEVREIAALFGEQVKAETAQKAGRSEASRSSEAPLFEETMRATGEEFEGGRDEIVSDKRARRRTEDEILDEILAQIDAGKKVTLAPEKGLTVKGKNGSARATFTEKASVVLDKLDFKGETGVFRPLYELLRKVLKSSAGETDIHYVPDAEFRRIAGQDSGGFHYLKGDTSYIVLPESAKNMSPSGWRHTVMHEVMHAASVSKLASLAENHPVRRKLRALMDEFLERNPEWKGEQAFENEREFLAEAYGNKKLQGALSNMEIGGKASRFGERIRTAFREVADTIRQMFGMPERATSMLEEVIKVSSEVVGKEHFVGETISDISRSEKALDKAKKQLVAKGVDPATADKLVKAISMKMTKGISQKALEPIIASLAKTYGKPLTGRPGSAQAAPTQQQQAQARIAQRGLTLGPKPTVPAGSKLRNVMSKLGFTQERMDKFREQALDFNRPVQVIQEKIENITGKLPDQLDFYGLKRTLTAKITGRLRDLHTTKLKQTDALIKKAEAIGFSHKQLGRALLAYGAEERNLVLQARDPSITAGSGMSTKNARKYLAAVARSPERQAILNEAVKLVKDLENIKLDALVNSGLISAADAARLRATYKKYVPMRGYDDEAIRAAQQGGRDLFLAQYGMDVAGRDIRKAGGRSTLADNPLQNLFADTARALERAETNVVNQATGEAIRLAGFTKADGVYVAENLAATPATTIREAMLDPAIIGFKENGVDRFLVFTDKKLAEAFRRLSPEAGHSLVQAAGSVMNVLKTGWTHYSPAFVLRHFGFRYPIEAIMNLRGLKEQGLDTNPLRYIKDAGSGIGDIRRYLQGKPVKDPKLGALMKEFEAAGGVVQFREVSDSFRLSQEYERLIKTNPSLLGKLKDFHHAWSDTLTAMDTAERLAIFKRAKDAGKSSHEAAIMARDATVDFSRRGASSPLISTWLAFGNVALQTTARLGKAFMTSPTYRRTLAGVIGGSAAIEMANYMMHDPDEDGTPLIEKVPFYERIQNVVIVIGRKKNGDPSYIKIPLPYPLFGFWAAGSAMSQAAMKNMGLSKMSNGDIAMRIAHGAAETFTPFGKNLAAPQTMVAPEILRPIADVAFNVDFTGQPIHTEHPKRGALRSEQGKPNTAEEWKAIAHTLEKIGMDFYPEDIKHLANHFIGAQLRTTPSSVVDVVRGKAEASKADQSRIFNLEKKAEVTTATLKALKAKDEGASLSAPERVLVQVAERRSGMTWKQLLAVNKERTERDKLSKEVNAAEGKQQEKLIENRNKFFKDKLKEFNRMGIVGGIDRH